MADGPVKDGFADDVVARLVHSGLTAVPEISVVVVDPQLRYRAVMGGAVAGRGYDPVDLIGRSVEDVVPGAVAEHYVLLFSRALGGESFVTTVHSADGTMTFECRFAPAVDAGSVIGALAVVRDVTAERLALADLAATDALHHLLMDNVSDAIALTTADEARYTWVSSSMTRVTGWQPDDLVGRTVYELVHPDDVASSRRRRAEVTAGADEAQVVCRFLRADGRWAWVEARIRPFGRPAVPAATLVTSLRDVTERVLLQQEFAQARDMFELSFAAAPIGMALVDTDGTFIKVNDALCVLLGRDEAALVGGTFQDVTHPDDLAADLDLLAETAAGQRRGYRIEKRYLRPDGTAVWALLAVSAVRREGRPRFYISQVEDITERKNAHLELERIATTDALTGLPNRVLLMDRLRRALARARRDGRLVGVVFIDLDRFKQVNDSLGHDAGDELLRRAAGRLSSAVREGDTITRLGGDEFIVLCEQIDSVDDVRRVAERIVERFAAPFRILDHDVTVTASVGVTAGDVEDGETLLKQADDEMYTVKRRSHDTADDDRGVDEVSSAAVDVFAHRRLTLRADIREGLPRGEIVVYFQPIVELPGSGTTAREALVRWQHPTLGLLAPAAFLGAVERDRLGITLGERVISDACAAAASWPDRVDLHVNVSARHLAESRFPEFISDCLEQSRLPAERLVLEITESLVLSASTSTLGCTASLAEMGVRLCLDDFGTGYSSIAALHRLPINSFKIDRSFVEGVQDDPASATLVEGLIDLGAHLGLDVVAEGVESAEQAAWLTDRGCPYAQGFHFGRPSSSSAPTTRV